MVDGLTPVQDPLVLFVMGSYLFYGPPHPLRVSSYERMGGNVLWGCILRELTSGPTFTMWCIYRVTGCVVRESFTSTPPVADFL